jgi:hypothetical protein
MTKTRTLLAGVISFLVLAASASTLAATLCGSDITAAPGTVVEIPVTVDDAAGIAGLQFCMQYDCEVLECVEGVAGEVTSSWQLTSGPGYGSCQRCIAMTAPALIPLPSAATHVASLWCHVVGYPGAQTDLCMDEMVLSDEFGNKLPVADCGCREFSIPAAIADILDFFGDAVSAGNLAGVGRTPTAAAGKLKALQNMLAKTEELIAKNNDSKACGQLEAAYKKMDGIAPPPDFVTGPAAVQLAAMTQSLAESLGCE